MDVNETFRKLRVVSVFSNQNYFKLLVLLIVFSRGQDLQRVWKHQGLVSDFCVQCESVDLQWTGQLQSARLI